MEMKIASFGTKPYSLSAIRFAFADMSRRAFEVGATLG